MNNFQSDINLGVSSSEKFFSGLVECVDSLIHHLGYRGKPYGLLHLKKKRITKAMRAHSSGTASPDGTSHVLRGSGPATGRVLGIISEIQESHLLTRH